MSFILDALKKSQRTRQHKEGPATVTAETATRQVQPHNWWAMVIAIVVLNVIVVSGFAWYLSRDQRALAQTQSMTGEGVSMPAPANAARAEQSARSGTTSIETSTSEPANGAQSSTRTVRPLSAEVRSATVGNTPQPTAGPPVSSIPVQTAPGQPTRSAVILPSEAEQAGYMPTLAELQLDQRIQLSPLHVDVHVFNENPQRRFVLINAAKYKEGERLKEGPLLEEIRSDGLVMYYRGQRFLVPRN